MGFIALIISTFIVCFLAIINELEQAHRYGRLNRLIILIIILIVAIGINAAFS